MVGREVAVSLELVLYLLGQHFHLLLFTMDQHHIFRFEMSKKLHNAFGVSMSTETHIENLQLYIYVSIIDVDLLLTHEDLVSYGSRLAVAWDDQGISFVASPLFEDLKGEATVQHTW